MLAPPALRLSLERAEQLCTLLRQLEAAGDRLGDAIPSHDANADQLALAAAHLGPLGLDLLRVGAALIDSASCFATLARLERDAVPDPEVDHAP